MSTRSAYTLPVLPSLARRPTEPYRRTRPRVHSTTDQGDLARSGAR